MIRGQRCAKGWEKKKSDGRGRIRAFAKTRGKTAYSPRRWCRKRCSCRISRRSDRPDKPVVTALRIRSFCHRHGSIRFGPDRIQGMKAAEIRQQFGRISSIARTIFVRMRLRSSWGFCRCWRGTAAACASSTRRRFSPVRLPGPMPIRHWREAPCRAQESYCQTIRSRSTQILLCR